MILDYRLLWFLPAVIVYLYFWYLAVLDMKKNYHHGFYDIWVSLNMLLVAGVTLFFGIKSYL